MCHNYARGEIYEQTERTEKKQTADPGANADADRNRSKRLFQNRKRQAVLYL